MPGIQVEINTWELQTLIAAHAGQVRVHANKREYACASDEKARATYLKTLLPKPQK